KRGISMLTLRSAAVAVPVSSAQAVSESFLRMARLMDKHDHAEQHHAEAERHGGPSGGAVLRVHLQEQQPGDAEDETGSGESVDEDAPNRAGMAAFVQVVEIRDPAAIGALVLELAGCQIDAEPSIAARTWHGDVELVLGPLELAILNTFVEPVVKPHGYGGSELRLAVALEERCQQRRRQRVVDPDDLGLRFDLTGMVQRDARDAEEQHAHQADGGADPMPLMKLL